MSSAKRPRTSSGADSARGSAAASAAGRLAASQPAAAASSGRRVVGSRQANPAAAAGEHPDPRDDAVDVDAPMEEADSWKYPEPSQLIDQLGPRYRYRLEPQVAPVFGKYKQEGLDAIVGEVMKFILQRTSAGHVVAHKDILNVLGDRCKNGAQYIINDARRRFMELYGYELHEIEIVSESNKRKSSGSASAASKTYILRMPSFKSVGLRRAFNHDLQLAKDQDDAAAKRGLLFWIYALIHAEESAQSNAEGADQQKGCAEPKLWRNLKTYCNIDRDAKSHEVFGNISNLIDEFVKQHYLMKVKWAVDPSANNDGSNQKVDTVAYRVGHRGLAEITQLDLYKGMCEQMTGTPVNQAHINQMKRNEDLLKGVHKKPAAAGAAPASQR